LSQSAAKADHEWVRLRQGIAIKVAMLTRLDTKDLVECNKVSAKDVSADEAVRSHVITRMLDRHEDAADRRQEGTADRNLGDATSHLRGDHQDAAGAAP
jgi:hypothetical protein